MDSKYSFPDNYFSAREAFRKQITRFDGDLESYPVISSNADLTIDVGMIGSADCEKALVVSSGLHGVEGFFGSAVQHNWLNDHFEKRPELSDTRIVLIHALNPYGFANVRRCNENNVDLNRNFIDDWSFRNNDKVYQDIWEAYQQYSFFLNPESPPSPFEPATIKGLFYLLKVGYIIRGQMEAKERPGLWNVPSVAKLGTQQLRSTLPVGQYDMPRGVFFGGMEQEATTQIVRNHLPQWIGSANAIFHLDFHTGLGKFARYKLLVENGANYQEKLKWLVEHFSSDCVEGLEGETAYQARGSMAGYCRKMFPDRRYYAVAAEFGTYKPINVLGALRAENRAHHFAEPGSLGFRWAKGRMMDVFCPASSKWRSETVRASIDLLNRSLVALDKLVAMRR